MHEITKYHHEMKEKGFFSYLEVTMLEMVQQIDHNQL